MNTVLDLAKLLLLTLALCYAYGLIAVVVWIGMFSLIVGHLPRWTWWEFALAPLMVGLVALASEALLGPSVRRFRGWTLRISPWKRAIFLGLLLVGAIGLSFLVAW